MMKHLGWTIRTSCRFHDDEPIYLLQYSGRRTGDVVDKVMAEARREGYRGDWIDRLRELGWNIVQLYGEER